MHIESESKQGLCVSNTAVEPWKWTFYNKCKQTMVMKILFTSDGTSLSTTVEYHINAGFYRFVTPPNPYDGVTLIDQYQPPDAGSMDAFPNLHFHAVPGSNGVMAVDNQSERHIFVDLIYETSEGAEGRMQWVLSPRESGTYMGQMKKLIAASWEPD